MARGPASRKQLDRAAPAAAKPESGLGKQAGEALAPLNFKVAKEFRREFKTFASQHDMKMVELLQEGFRLVKKRHGAG